MATRAPNDPARSVERTYLVLTLLTTLASQGTQYLGGYLVARGIGDANRNTIVSIVFNMVLAGLGTAGVAGAREAFLVVPLRLLRRTLRCGTARQPSDQQSRHKHRTRECTNNRTGKEVLHHKMSSK
jgi:hypothetical protein